MRQNSQPTHWSSSQHPATEQSTCTVPTNPVTQWGGNYCGPIFQIRKLRSKKIGDLLMGVREGGKIQTQAAWPHARGSKKSCENNSFHFKSPFQYFCQPLGTRVVLGCPAGVGVNSLTCAIARSSWTGQCAQGQSLSFLVSLSFLIRSAFFFFFGGGTTRDVKWRIGWEAVCSDPWD